MICEIFVLLFIAIFQSKKIFITVLSLKLTFLTKKCQQFRDHPKIYTQPWLHCFKFLYRRKMAENGYKLLPKQFTLILTNILSILFIFIKISIQRAIFLIFLIAKFPLGQLPGFFFRLDTRVSR